MSTFRAILTSTAVSPQDVKYQEFYQECSLFKKLVDKDSTLTHDEMEEIEKEFRKKFPEKSFQEFLTEYELNTDDVCLKEDIYDTTLRRSCLPHIYSAVNKKQTNNFNIQEFLRESIANNQTYYLNFDPDPEIDLDDDDFEERNKQLILADQALKSIGTIALCLNKQRKELPYTLMEVKAENFIN